MAKGKDIQINLVLNDKQISAKILNADKLVNTLRKSATKTSDVFLKWSIITTGFNSAMQIGRQVINVFQSITEPFMQFESGMKNVQAIIGGTNEQLDLMGAEVLELQKNFGLTSEELTGALYQIVSAGIPAGEAIQFLDIAARSSIAGLTDTQTAADGLTTVLNAFHLEAEQTENIADIMFNTVKLGKTTFEELARSLSDVAPLAATSGISFEEISAAIASLTKQGVPTAQAITQIKSAIFGMNQFLGDGWTATMSLQEGMQLLAEKTHGSSTELMKMVGRKEAVLGILGLTGENARTAAEDLNAMETATGEMGKAFDTNTDTMQHKMDVLGESFNAFLINSVGSIEPLLSGALEVGQELILKVENIGTALNTFSESDGFKALKFLTDFSPGNVLFKLGGGEVDPEKYEEVRKIIEESNKNLGDANVNLDFMSENLVSVGDALITIVPATDGINQNLGETNDLLSSTPQTVNEISAHIKQLKTDIGDLIPGTDAYYNKLKEIEKFQSLISPKKEEAGGGDGTGGGADPFAFMFGRRMNLLDQFDERRTLSIELGRELTDAEIEDMTLANDLQLQFFEEEKLREEETAFNDQLAFSGKEELLNMEMNLEQQRADTLKKINAAKTLDDKKQLIEEIKTTDKKIQAIKSEVEAREIATASMITAGLQQYDASKDLGEQLGNAARNAIKRIIAEAVITQIAKVLASFPYPFNLILAPMAGLAVQHLLELAIPSFATGVRDFSGGMALVGERGPELVSMPGGSSVFNNDDSISILESIAAGRSSVAASSGSSSNVDIIRAINNQTERLERVERIAKILPDDFEERYSDYTLKEEHTG